MGGSAITDHIAREKPELVFAVVAPLGCDLTGFEGVFAGIIKQYGYALNVVTLSALAGKFHSERLGVTLESKGAGRIRSHMKAGNTLRTLAGRGDILALMAIADIRNRRQVGEDSRTAPLDGTVHFLRSLKHPEEVDTLRRVYGAGFFLIGLHATDKQREEHLTGPQNIQRDEALDLMQIDAHESMKLGQQTRDAFSLADVFIPSGSEKFHLERFLDAIFGHPYISPTRDEHAMFLAYGASLRSAQMARQVGAVIISKDGELIATGTNEVPSFRGGQYHPEHPNDKRDHKLEYDSNNREIQKICSDVFARVRKLPKADAIDEQQLREAIEQSAVDDLTEYGRPVHAEMEALLACARTGISTRGATLYTTTFPCHNCAKHIVGAGIVKVHYVEPYPKSRALDLHEDSIALDDPNAKDRVLFLPFVGVSARRYFDIFSMKLGGGIELKRKSGADIIQWGREGAVPRTRISPYSYLERETKVTAKEIDEAEAAMVEEFRRREGKLPEFG